MTSCRILEKGDVAKMYHRLIVVGMNGDLCEWVRDLGSGIRMFTIHHNNGDNINLYTVLGGKTEAKLIKHVQLHAVEIRCIQIPNQSLLRCSRRF